jgi:hypothetical protein
MFIYFVSQQLCWLSKYWDRLQVFIIRSDIFPTVRNSPEVLWVMTPWRPSDYEAEAQLDVPKPWVATALVS